MREKSHGRQQEQATEQAMEQATAGSLRVPGSHQGLGCRLCRRPMGADGNHAVPSPWPHQAHPAWATIGWTTRGLAVFATIPEVAEYGGPAEDPADDPDDDWDDAGDGQGDDLVMGRWWDVPRRPCLPLD